jgi:hypothetical protein
MNPGLPGQKVKHRLAGKSQHSQGLTGENLRKKLFTESGQV